MTERGSRIAIAIFTIGTAILIPASTLPGMPFNPTIYAGFTLINLYLMANQKLLVVSHTERNDLIRRGMSIPIALYLGIFLEIVGFYMLWSGIHQ